MGGSGCSCVDVVTHLRTRSNVIIAVSVFERMSDDEEFNLNLLKSIARSEGLNSKKNEDGNNLKRYFPILKHPLPISDHRHEHEKILRKVLSCKREFQGIAAITLGDAWSLEEVFMRDGQVVLQDKNGSHPIHIAVQMNSIDCLMVLINIGVDLNKRNNLGFTPLQIARASSYTQVEKLLIENNAKLDFDENAERIMHHHSILDVIPQKYKDKKSLEGSLKISGSQMSSFTQFPKNSTLF